MSSETEKLFLKWKEANPTVSDKSIYNYTRQYFRIHKWGYANHNLDIFIQNLKTQKPLVLEFLQTITNFNTKSSYLAMLCSFYRSNLSGYYAFKIWNEEILIWAREILVDIKSTITNNLDEHKLTEIQDNNWTTKLAIKKTIRARGKFCELLWEKESYEKAEFQMIQQYVLQSLYMGFDEHPPIRCNYNMEVVQDLAPFPGLNYVPQKNNYLALTGNGLVFIINKYKTSKTYGSQVIPVCQGLTGILLKWIGYCNKVGLYENGKYLLYNTRKKRITENLIASYIPEAFSLTQKKLTIDTLRHIFISETCNLGNGKHFAKLMMHSTTEQAQYYKIVD